MNELKANSVAGRNGGPEHKNLTQALNHNASEYDYLFTREVSSHLDSLRKYFFLIFQKKVNSVRTVKSGNMRCVLKPLYIIITTYSIVQLPDKIIFTVYNPLFK